MGVPSHNCFLYLACIQLPISYPLNTRDIFALPLTQTQTALLWTLFEALVPGIMSLSPKEVSYLSAVNNRCLQASSHIWTGLALALAPPSFSPPQPKEFLDSVVSPKTPPFSLSLAPSQRCLIPGFHPTLGWLSFHWGSSSGSRYE